MNQEKIGKFIALNRKKKKLTQEELAVKLGVSKNAVSKWERGICLMDMSLLKPLSEILDISINELLQGEKLNSKENLPKIDDEIIHTINYGNEIIYQKEKSFGIMLIILGIVIVFCAMSFLVFDNNYNIVYVLIGEIISLFGIIKLVKAKNNYKKWLFSLGFVLFYTLFLFLIDYFLVTKLDCIPRLSYSKEYYNNVIIYKTPFYYAFRVNFATKNEYYIVDSKKELKKENILNIPFNYKKSGIHNLLKYATDNINEQSINRVISLLPLDDYGHDLEIEKGKIIVKYKILDWFLNDHYFIEKGIIYNSIALFRLYPNLDEINYLFGKENLLITRADMKDSFSGFNEIVNPFLDANAMFEKYIYYNLDDNFATYYYKVFFIDKVISKTKKIEVYHGETYFKTITNIDEIHEIIEILKLGRRLAWNSAVTSEGESCHIKLYDENNMLLKEFLIWSRASFGEKGKEYLLDTKSSDRLISLLQ